MFTINGFSYIPSQPGRLVQGVKGNRVPNGAIRGGCGSFIVSNIPAKMLVTLENEEGKKVCRDIAGIVRPFIKEDGKRLTETNARQIYRQIAGRKTETDTIDEKMLKNAWKLVNAQ